MENRFITDIAASTAHRPSREGLATRVLNDTSLLPVLLQVAFNAQDKNHHKACWIMELVFENQISLLDAYLETFCIRLKDYTHDGAIRSVSKVCLFLANRWDAQPFTLSAQQKELITEACFDWLINPDGKVANKAYAMRTLYILGKDTEWVYPELKRILSEDFSAHSAAYKAAAKELLQKMKL